MNKNTNALKQNTNIAYLSPRLCKPGFLAVTTIFFSFH
jgi:hypothetical protein